MAGYFLYSIDSDVFTQLTTSPTREQGEVLADYVLEDRAFHFEERDEEAGPSIWPEDREVLVERILKRLASSDWYSDLSYADAIMWDDMLHGLSGEAGETIGIDLQCSDYESIYWDCAEIAAQQGASMMAEPVFGNRAFRYFGKPSSEYTVYPMYSFFTAEQTQELLKQLKRVEPHFASLSDDSVGSPREQFFEGLLPTVKDAAAKGRVLWVQTDT